MMWRKILGIVLASAAAWSSARAEHVDVRLTVDVTEIAVNGERVEKLTINGGVPGPTLRWREGDHVTIHVTNNTDEPTSVHWHGIMLPGIMDGAPGFNGFLGIKPGETYTYTFHIRQSGTYWYHSHSGTQDQSVLGAIVIEPLAPDAHAAARDEVILFSDLTHEDSDQVLTNLKADSGWYNNSRRTLMDFFSDAGRSGFGDALRDRMDWGSMRMDPTDLADVTGYAFLANGRTPDENETVIFRKGEPVRLRLINGSAMTFFDVRIPGLPMTVVAADGNDVQPVTVDELRMGVAERYDIIVTPQEDKAYTLFAESLDRAGYALVTLAPTAGMRGLVPERRPRAILSMDDMGMAHAGHGESSTADPHAGHTMHGAGAAADPHAGHAMHVATPPNAQPVGWASGFPADARVLSYADLFNRHANVDNAPPARIITVRLTGNMERYVWSMNDQVFDPASGIHVRHGERVRIQFVNETMMAHPMHLHGMFFELENGSPDHRPLKDTVIVPPGKSVSVVLTAVETGSWPLHCHLLYHMVSGMMTQFVVEPPGASDDAITPSGATVPVAPLGFGGGHNPHAGHGSGHGSGHGAGH